MFGLTPEEVLGKPLIHVPINLISQEIDGEKVIGTFQTTLGQKLMWGSDKTHVMISGDVFIRPHLIFHTNELRGVGIAGLAKCGFISDAWEQIF